MDDMFLTVFGVIINAFVGYFRFLGRLITRGYYSHGNLRRRGVKVIHRAQTEAQLLTGVDPSYSVMISGGTNGTTVRDRLMTQIAAQVQQAACPVVILHKGNAELERRVSQLPGAVICNANTRNYDPFRDLNNDAQIADVLLNNVPRDNDYNLDVPRAKSYVRGIAYFYIHCLGRVPSLNALCDATDIASKGYAAILNAAQSVVNQGSAMQSDFDTIRRLLDAGQTQELALHDYLWDMLQELSSCTPKLGTGLQDAQYVSLRRAIARRRLLCIDVGSVGREQLFYNLFANELILNRDQGRGLAYLILDGIGLKSSTALCKLLEGQNATPHCISCENVYAALIDGKMGNPLFNSLAAGCQMHVTLHQPQNAAALWSEHYGTFKKQKRSSAYNWGSATGHGAQILPGSNSGRFVQYTDVDERVWRPDDLTKLRDLEMVIALRDSDSTRHMEAHLKPEP